MRRWDVRLGAIASATVALALGTGSAAAKPKPKPKPATAAPDAPASAPATTELDPRPLYSSLPLFSDYSAKAEFALHPGCDESLAGPELDACKKGLAAAGEKARTEVEGAAARIEVFVRRGDFDPGRGVYDIEIGKNGLLRERGVALDVDVGIMPAALAAPKAASALSDFGVASYVVPSEKMTAAAAEKSPLKPWSRGSGWAIVKIAKVANLTPDCAKKPCPEFPAVLVKVLSWGVPLGGGKAVLDGKVVAEFGPVSAAADDPADLAAKAPGTPGGTDVISAGPDKIDAMLGSMGDGTGGSGKSGLVAGTAELSPADITRVINDRKWRLKKCASFGEGLLSYEFVVEVDGTVHDVVLKTAEFKDKPLAKCAEKILAETVFPAHKGPPKKLTFPFIIK